MAFPYGVDGNRYHTPDETGKGSIVCRVLSLPVPLWPFFNGAFGTLLNPDNWLQVGDYQKEEIIQEFYNALDGMRDCMMIGSIIPFVTTSIPPHCLPCNGSTYDRVDYPLLYASLPSSLIVDADSFITPDLTGVFLHGGSLPDVGVTGGQREVTLSIANLPPHTHGYQGSLFDVDIEPPVGAPQAFTARLNPTATTGSTGDGESFDNRPPFYTVHYAIVAR
jgi:microcystin-dependent protein